MYWITEVPSLPNVSCEAPDTVSSYSWVSAIVLFKAIVWIFSGVE
jgi:hypothetical protein